MLRRRRVEQRQWPYRSWDGAAGFTLIEVLLAALLLSLAGIMLLTASSRCLGVMKRGKLFQTAQWKLSAMEAEHYPDPEAPDPQDWEVTDQDFERRMLKVELMGFPEDVKPDEFAVLHSVFTWSETASDAFEDSVRIYCPKTP